jgi:diguanylate cyclase (GGDEF)-like protein
VARYGGEEFACILPETDFNDAMTIARELEQQIRNLAIAHIDSEAAPVVTISLGVAGRHAGTPGDADSLLAAADAQLYKAKNAGRGRACGEALKST